MYVFRQDNTVDMYDNNDENLRSVEWGATLVCVSVSVGMGSLPLK